MFWCSVVANHIPFRTNTDDNVNSTAERKPVTAQSRGELAQLIRAIGKHKWPKGGNPPPHTVYHWFNIWRTLRGSLCPVVIDCTGGGIMRKLANLPAACGYVGYIARHTIHFLAVASILHMLVA